MTNTVDSNFDKRLHNHLYRATCPTPQELGECNLGLLSPERSDEVEEHLAHCPHCQDEVVVFGEFLADVSAMVVPEPPESRQNTVWPEAWLDRVVQLWVVDRRTAEPVSSPFALSTLAQLLESISRRALPDGTRSQLSFGLRGSEAPVATAPNADGDTVFYEVKSDPESPDGWRLHGQLLGATHADLEVRLVLDDGTVLATSEVDGVGFELVVSPKE